jgi:MFS family permease
MLTLRRLFRPARLTPAEHRHNFHHWYMDVVWFGILNGSTLVFLSVFCARQGATVQQLGLLSASPALVNLLFTFPAGALIRHMPTWKATCWSALLTRIFYVLFIPLPFLLAPAAQVWVIILLSFVMNIPGTVMAVIGSAYFAETVPDAYRAQVVATRMALLSASTMLTALVVGQILERIAFPNGYIVVFLMGFIGAAFSTYHLFRIRPAFPKAAAPAPAGHASPGSQASGDAGGRVHPAPRAEREGGRALREILAFLPRSQLGFHHLRLDVLSGRYGLVMLMLFWFQFSVFMGGPVFPAYQVDALKMSDQVISLGSSVFWIFHFLGSTQAATLAGRWGFKRLTGIGVLMTCLSTTIFIYSTQFWIYTICQVIAGLGWSLISTGQLNYLLQHVPADDRPAHLSWYNIVVNVAVLLASLLAPQLVSVSGLAAAMFVVVGLRVLAGGALLKWG